MTQLDTLREAYRPVAVRGSILYFVIADLALIDPMYQYSLAYFTTLFDACITNSAKSDVLEERLYTLTTTITKAVFRNVSRGLLEKDKMVFSFLIAAQVLRRRGDISDAEWNLLLRGIVPGLSSGVDPEGALGSTSSLFSKFVERPQWIPHTQWEMCCVMESSIPAFVGFTRDLAENAALWQAYAESTEIRIINKAPLSIIKFDKTKIRSHLQDNGILR